MDGPTTSPRHCGPRSVAPAARPAGVSAGGRPAARATMPPVPLRVVVDATPLLGVRTGVGRYVAGLLSGLADLGADEDAPALTLTAFTVRGAAGLADARPPGGRVVHRPAPARGLQWLWARGELPRAELLTGRAEVLHATNFVLPPSRAAGVVTVHDLAYDRHGDTVTARQPALPRPGPPLAAAGGAGAVPVARDRGRAAGALRAGRRPGAGHAARRLPGLGAGGPAGRGGTGAASGLPERYLLFVGAREPRKDLPVLLAAHRAARASDPDVPDLVLTGPPGLGRRADRRRDADRLPRRGRPAGGRGRRGRAGAAVARRGLRAAGARGPGLRHAGAGQRDPRAPGGGRRTPRCCSPSGTSTRSPPRCSRCPTPASTGRARRAQAAPFTWGAAPASPPPPTGPPPRDRRRLPVRRLVTAEVTVLVVTWNGAHLLPPCLASLRAQTVPVRCSSSTTPRPTAPTRCCAASTPRCGCCAAPTTAASPAAAPWGSRR